MNHLLKTVQSSITNLLSGSLVTHRGVIHSIKEMEGVHCNGSAQTNLGSENSKPIAQAVALALPNIPT